jgi:hypothetical protein
VAFRPRYEPPAPRWPPTRNAALPAQVAGGRQARRVLPAPKAGGHQPEGPTLPQMAAPSAGGRLTRVCRPARPKTGGRQVRRYRPPAKAGGRLPPGGGWPLPPQGAARPQVAVAAPIGRARPSPRCPPPLAGGGRPQAPARDRCHTPAPGRSPKGRRSRGGHVRSRTRALFAAGLSVMGVTDAHSPPAGLPDCRSAAERAPSGPPGYASEPARLPVRNARPPAKPTRPPARIHPDHPPRPPAAATIHRQPP